MLWVCHVQRLLSQSSRLSTSKVLFLHPAVCNGCRRRQFSQPRVPQAALTRSQCPSFGSTGYLIRYLATTGDTGENASSSASTETSKMAAAPKAEAGSTNTTETVVKGRQLKKSAKSVQPTGKTKSTRKKTDFNKEYLDNIYVEKDRARSEYLLTEEQLSQLPVMQRRSPYPGSDQIEVFHRKHIMAKAIEVWGSLENLKKEKELRRQWEHIDSFLKKDLEMKGNTPTHKISLVGVKEAQKAETIFKTGSGRVVLWAILVNGINALMKFVAWLYTGSHSMFSECIHSVADTVNQIILAIGINQSLRQADLEHPYGWANFRNVASLISGVGIFCLGAGFAIYHGVIGLIHPHTMDSLSWGISILGGSFISEGGTLIIAINEVRQSAKRENMTFRNYVWQGRDPSTNVVLLEDAAAVVGVSIAATCMSIAYYTGNPVADAIGSIAVGSLLGGVASFIIYTNTIALVGRSIPIDQKAKLMDELENDRMIRALHDVKATDMGGSSVRFKAEVDFDGKEVTRYYLEKSDLESLLNEVQSLKTSEELESFMLKHGENIVDTLGGEVDRIEKNLKKKHPEVRHVDLEQL